jgi:hypothetical protein
MFQQGTYLQVRLCKDDRYDRPQQGSNGHGCKDHHPRSLGPPRAQLIAHPAPGREETLLIQLAFQAARGQ